MVLVAEAVAVGQWAGAVVASEAVVVVVEAADSVDVAVVVVEVVSLAVEAVAVVAAVSQGEEVVVDGGASAGADTKKARGASW